MKILFTTFIVLIFHSVLAQPVEEWYELRLRLFNEFNEELNCDSLISDELAIVKLSSSIIPFSYDSNSNYFIVNVTSLGTYLAMRWKRKGKTMDLFFEIHFPNDTINKPIHFFTFNNLKFEEGQFEVRILNNAEENVSKESFDKYHSTITIVRKPHELDYNWITLKGYNVVSAPNNYFVCYGGQNMTKIKCH